MSNPGNGLLPRDPLPGLDLVILMYHHVGQPPAGATRGLYVTPKQLAGQITWLRKSGARFCTFRDLVGALPVGAHQAAGTGFPVILSFDDGLLDVYTQGFPVLRALGVPAVIYPVGDDLGRRGVHWPDNADPTPVDLMDSAQLAQMARAGMELGSHLMRHVPASTLPPEELAGQLRQSRKLLGTLQDSECLSIAYPFGVTAPEIAAAARQAGFAYGVTTQPGRNSGADPMLLHREPTRGTRWHHPFRFQRQMAKRLQAS